MEQILLDKKEALLTLLKEREILEFFQVRDASDNSCVYVDGRETLKNGSQATFRIILDSNPITSTRINFYQLLDSGKRSEMIETINQVNEHVSFSKFFLSADNLLTVEFSYTVPNELFRPEVLLDLVNFQLDMIDDFAYHELVEKVIEEQPAH